MGSKCRRDFLKIFARSVSAALALPLLERADAQPAARTPATVDRFIDPLPIPNTLRPVDTHKGADIYRVRMMELQHRFHSQLAPSRLWGYERQYPGPTFEALRGRPIEVRWENRLPMQHIFGIDPHIHGAMPPAPAVRTVPHLHGSRTTSESDGLPEKWFTPGTSAHYLYPNDQQAATLWYHDHALGITRLNVYAGLSGFYWLRDEEERGLNLPAGEYEIPLIIQDRNLDANGQLIYTPTFDDGQAPAPGGWAPEFFGELPVVNGALYPHLEVEPRAYRLRILNSSNSRFFGLYLNLAKRPTDVPELIPLQQIGSDGGFLPETATIEHILLAPAERADVIVDFSKLEGRTVTLSNNAPAPYPGWDFAIAHHAQLYELMQFRVTRPLARPAANFSLPTPSSFHRLDTSTPIITTRDFVLTEEMDAQGHSLGMRINAKGYDDPVTEKVKLGTLEKWRFINTTEDAHPMHVHLVQFQIVERQGFDTEAFSRGQLQLVGRARKPAPNEAGWKDTAVVNPRDVLTILVRFEGYAGRYVYHCHMLEHEDNDMMRPYEVVA
jgi:spore coat protein A, manganese oxidase